MLVTDNKQIYEYIKELGIIPNESLDEAYEQAEEDSKSLGEVLTDKNLISDDDFSKIVADIYSIPFIKLSGVPVVEDVLNVIPEIVAKKHNLIAFEKDAEGLHIATSNPRDTQIFSFIEKKVGVPVVLHLATEFDIRNSLTLYNKNIQEAFEDIISANVEKAKGSKKPDVSIVKIVETLISYAYQNKTSDIHIEPYEEKSLIRFRIDGILHDILDLPISLHEQVVTRIKVLAKLRTDEHMAAQDGKISTDQDGERVDIRVSIVPITEGEKVVMRLLSERSRQFSLKDLGFSDEDLKKVKAAYEKPHGMILVTGPTGSGKTTTLYAILKLLNDRDVNIMTIEDPVEYDIEGINQIQVNPKTDLTFAKGLRSIVRQDPDIVLVGEIRDEETADISINAAMTGHLVLSTLHTNDAPTAVPRLLDLGVEPYLVGSTMNIVVAQRLVRKICTKCRYSEEFIITDDKEGSRDDEIGASVLKKYLGEGKYRIYKGKGCPVCHGTGYLGRVGIFEVMLIADNIRKAIIDRKDSSEIKKLAVENGMKTMLTNGIEKLLQGETTIDEILRVTKD